MTAFDKEQWRWLEAMSLIDVGGIISNKVTVDDGRREKAAYVEIPTEFYAFLRGIIGEVTMLRFYLDKHDDAWIFGFMYDKGKAADYMDLWRYKSLPAWAARGGRPPETVTVL